MSLMFSCQEQHIGATQIALYDLRMIDNLFFIMHVMHLLQISCSHRLLQSIIFHSRISRSYILSQCSIHVYSVISFSCPICKIIITEYMYILMTDALH